MVNLTVALVVFVGSALLIAGIAFLVKKLMDNNPPSGGSPGGSPPGGGCYTPSCYSPPSPHGKCDEGYTWFPDLQRCLLNCGPEGFCDQDEGQDCVKVTNANCSQSLYETAPCNQSSGIDPPTYENCIIDCDSQKKIAYFCASKRGCGYDTTNTVHFPASLGDSFYPLFNVDAWQADLVKCNLPLTPDNPDTYCQHGATPSDPNTSISMRDSIESQTQGDTDQTVDRLRHTIAQTELDFDLDSYQMRQSIQGYACLPTQSASPSESKRPQGYRYVLYPNPNDGGQQEKCQITDCLNAALGDGIQEIRYDDRTKFCMATICEGDGCEPSTKPPTPNVNVKLKDPDHPYCDYEVSMKDNFEAFLEANCPTGLSGYDCLPDNTNSLKDPSYRSAESVSLKQGLQFWKPGQLTARWFTFNNSGESLDWGNFVARPMVARVSGKDSGDQVFSDGDQLKLDESEWVGSEPTNVLDYLGKEVYIDSYYMGWGTPCGYYNFRKTIPEKVAPEITPYPFSFQLPDDYSTKVEFVVDEFNNVLGQECGVLGHTYIVQAPADKPQTDE